VELEPGDDTAGSFLLTAARLTANDTHRLVLIGADGVDRLELDDDVHRQFGRTRTRHQARPRDWTTGEILTLQVAAERSWAAVDRLRAEQRLRESESLAFAAHRETGFGRYEDIASFTSPVVSTLQVRHSRAMWREAMQRSSL